MPHDRLITVNVQSLGHRDQHGNYIPGPVTAIRTWATRRDRYQDDIEAEGGVFDSTRRDWRIRWNRLIADAPTSRLEVVDDDGAIFNALNIVEVTRERGEPLRRRFLTIQGVNVI